MKISVTLACKLASVVVHADEGLSDLGHHFDLVALRQLIDDPEVKEWLKELGPLVPVKRAARAEGK